MGWAGGRVRAHRENGVRRHCGADRALDPLPEVPSTTPLTASTGTQVRTSWRNSGLTPVKAPAHIRRPAGKDSGCGWPPGSSRATLSRIVRAGRGAGDDRTARPGRGGPRPAPGESHADRGPFIDTLETTHVHGSLDRGRPDTRQDQALTARTNASLATLTAHVPPAQAAAAAASPPAPAPRRPLARASRRCQASAFSSLQSPSPFITYPPNPSTPPPVPAQFLGGPDRCPSRKRPVERTQHSRGAQSPPHQTSNPPAGRSFHGRGRGESNPRRRTAHGTQPSFQAPPAPAPARPAPDLRARRPTSGHRPTRAGRAPRGVRPTPGRPDAVEPGRGPAPPRLSRLTS